MSKRWVWAAAWMAGCVVLDPVEPRPDGAGCESACDRGRDLGCEYAQDIEGETCEQVCADAEAFRSGTFGVDCLTTAATCDACL